MRVKALSSFFSRPWCRPQFDLSHSHLVIHAHQPIWECGGLPPFLA